MPSSRTHVLGLPVNPFRTLASSWCSQRCTTRCLSLYWILSLEIGCSSRTTADLATFFRVGWMWLLPLRRLSIYYFEHPGPRRICFYKTKEQRVQTQISQELLDKNSIICLQEVHGKDEFLQAIQVLAPRLRLFGTFLLVNENAGGSAFCIQRGLLLEEALVTLRLLVMAAIIFSTFDLGNTVSLLSMSNLNLSLPFCSYVAVRVSFTHWLAYPRRVGFFFGDFNICDPEEGRFNVWNQTFSNGDPGKTAVFYLLSICP